ncbi:MAG: hypothetical protein OEZ58_03035 [Gammaproteobacteria bacterium]|nr:hypothetical protein [Gammaproteobacteria bacterium]MDH5727938.1 hypothetical protein [Gammaproteobacteria bacterium]
MATQEQIDVLLNAADKKSQTAHLFLTRYSASDRSKRALTALGICLLGAAVTLFIPIAHFFLVPAFLIAGPVFFVARSKQEDSKEKVVGLCPHHHKEIIIEMDASDKLPKWTYCPECNGSLQIASKDSE